MKVISATLPGLGFVDVTFHQESKALLEAIGEGELQRLAKVEHLGVTSHLYNGANHSRLDYVLLQCASIQLISKLFKGDRHLALSSKVYVSEKRFFSSGEEFLKCLAIIGNFGHLRNTFASERCMLSLARKNKEFREWIVPSNLPKGLKKRCSEIVDGEEEWLFHLVISLRRIQDLPNFSHQREIMKQLVRAYLIDSREIHPKSEQRQRKLKRLLSLYSQVRNQAVVALDSYNSHIPIVSEVVPSLLNFSRDQSADSWMMVADDRLRALSSWLADELFFSPESIALTVDYEARFRRKTQIFWDRPSTSHKKTEWLNSKLADGFGAPSNRKICCICRVALKQRHAPELFSNRRQSERDVWVEIGKPKGVLVGLTVNLDRTEVYIDLFQYEQVARKTVEPLKALSGLLGFVVERLRNFSTDFLNRRFDTLTIDDRQKERLIGLQLNRTIERSGSYFEAIFTAVLRQLIKKDRTIIAEKFTLGGGNNGTKVYLKNCAVDGLDQIQSTWNFDKIDEISHIDRAAKKEFKYVFEEVKGIDKGFVICGLGVYKFFDEHDVEVTESDGIIMNFVDQV